MKFLIAFSLAAASLFGQGALSPVPIQQPLDNSGKIFSGCLYTYATGSTTPLATYSNATLTSANTNPIVLDASGRAPAIFLSPVSYKFVLAQKFLNTCPATPGTVLWSQDPVFDSGQAVKIAILALLAAPSGSNLVGYSQSNSYSAGTVGKRLQRVINVADAPYSAIADGTGAGGTDQSNAFQAALDSLGATGGKLLIPEATLAYSINTVIIPSGVTVEISPGTVVQKLHGSSSNPVFRCGDGTEAIDNCWITGGGTIDGNRANISDTGDGGYMGIRFNGASNSGARNLLIENAWTDGIYVSCYNTDVEGNNVLIDNVRITNSRRNNISVICGNGTTVSNSRLDHATGTAPQAGIDIEPDTSAMLVSPVSIVNTEVDNNSGVGIAFTGDTGDPNMQLNLINNYVHNNNTEGVSATNAYGTSPNQSGSLQIIGGSYLNNNTSADTAAISFAGWANVTISTTTGGNARGIDASANNGKISLGPGFISGTLYDVSIDGPNAIALMAGATLDPNAPNLIQPSEIANVLQPMFGLPSTFTGNGLTYWPSLSGTVDTAGTAVTCVSGTCGWSLAVFPNRQIVINTVTYPVGEVVDATHITLLGSGAGTQSGVAYFPVRSGRMLVSTYCKVAESSSAPAVTCTDNTITGQVQVISSEGTRVGSQSAHRMCLETNNTCRVIVPPGGLAAYANNAAAILGGLSAGMVYEVSGSNPLQLAIVF